MTHDQFWQIIADTCRSDPRSAEEWDDKLADALATWPADEIVEWNHIFDELAKQAYRTDLWAAAYLINGGASDDGFYYFRCWLIGMGKATYENAMADPDSLADVASPDWLAEGIVAEAEIYGAAHTAWMRVTGNDYDSDYPARNESAELAGDEWDFDDDIEMQKRLPRLAAVYEAVMSTVETQFQRLSNSEDDGLCITIESKKDAQKWVQISILNLNLAYPFDEDPINRLRAIGIAIPPELELEEWTPNAYATFSHAMEELPLLRDFLIQYMEKVLGVSETTCELRVSDTWL